MQPSHAINTTNIQTAHLRHLILARDDSHLAAFVCLIFRTLVQLEEGVGVSRRQAQRCPSLHEPDVGCELCDTAPIGWRGILAWRSVSTMQTC